MVPEWICQLKGYSSCQCWFNISTKQIINLNTGTSLPVNWLNDYPSPGQESTWHTWRSSSLLWTIWRLCQTSTWQNYFGFSGSLERCLSLFSEGLLNESQFLLSLSECLLSKFFFFSLLSTRKEQVIGHSLDLCLEGFSKGDRLNMHHVIVKVSINGLAVNSTPYFLGVQNTSQKPFEIKSS